MQAVLHPLPASVSPAGSELHWSLLFLSRGIVEIEGAKYLVSFHNIVGYGRAEVCVP